MAVGKFACDRENSSGSSLAKVIWYNSKLWDFPDLIQRSSDFTGLSVQRGSQEEQRAHLTASHHHLLVLSVSQPSAISQSISGGPQGRTAAAAKSLQSCPTLCDPTGCSPPGSPIHGIFQARVLEWVAIAFFIRVGLASCYSAKMGSYFCLVFFFFTFCFRNFPLTCCPHPLHTQTPISRASTGISSRHLYFCNWASLLVGTEVPF